jgi:hypothetical protein
MRPAADVDVDVDVVRTAGQPRGDSFLAILQASQALRTERALSGQGATFRELIARSQVGVRVAKFTVGKMRQRRHLDITGWRKVSYSNKPVAEYAPAQGPDLFTPAGHGVLDHCLATWTR